MIRRITVLLLAAGLAASVIPSAFALEMPSRGALPGLGRLAPVFRAPQIPATVAADLAPPAVPKAAVQANPNGPQKVGQVRELATPVAITGWVPVPGGYVARFRTTSQGALGIRVRLDLGTMPGTMELRAQGDEGAIQTMYLDPTIGPQAWSPWTPGATQVIELFTAVLPGNDQAVTVGALVHFDASPIATTAAGICTLEATCAATDSLLDAATKTAILDGRHSEAKLTFTEGGSAFLCSGTLINTDKFPAPYILTANHCIDNETVARTVSAIWSYESNIACQDQSVPTLEQSSGGMQLVFTNFDVDSTLLLMNQQPPADAVYSAWSTSLLNAGAPVVSVSHPKGDTTRYAVGSVTDNNVGLVDWPELFYGITFTRGIIEGGSSGSGLFILSGNSLQLRAILTGTTVQNSADGMSCTDLNELALYSRFDIFGSELAPYVTTAGKPVDDAPNRFQDVVAGASTNVDNLDARGTVFSVSNQKIDYVGDVDVYRITTAAPSWISAWSDGPNGANLDTVGTLLDSRGVEISYNDDAQASSNHFGLTTNAGTGTFYLQVMHWDPTGTGTYNVHIRADHLTTNYTDLWWNPAESGWGINLNHQDNTIFATLFTYDASGAPMWLVMSGGTLQSDGSYLGTLYRTTGPAFNASPFTPSSVVATSVGTMKLTFTDSSHATLNYSFNGTSVTKAITRQAFSTQPTCTWSAFDRSYSGNFQDLWWNPNESGWGINIAHQGDILFATLFDYDANGKGMWLVMSDGAKISDGKYSGALYSTTGPAFNASPWPGIAATPVGTMTFAFTDGNTGTLTYTVNGASVTKSIQRQVFGALKTDCGPQDQ